MLARLYKISKGLTSNKITNKYAFGILLSSYLLIFVYVAAYFDVSWSDHSTPLEVVFDNRDISILMYSNTLSILIYITYAIKIYWLNMQSEVFFNKTSMKILFTNNISGVKVYLYFVVKRVIDLFLIDLLIVLSLVSVYFAKDLVFVFPLVQNIHVLFIVSVLLIGIYDSIYFLSSKSTSSSLLTFFIVIIVSLLNFAIRPILGYSTYVEYVNFLPDLLSIGYHYLLLSFDASYSAKQIYYPLFFLLLLSFFLYRSSKSMFLKFSKG